MIGIDFIGRLGNQMFTYAFMRCLIAQRQIKDERIIANFKRSLTGSDKEGFEDSLQYFNVLSYETDNTKDLVLSRGSIIQKILYLFYMLCTRISFIYHHDTLMSFIDSYVDKYGILFSGASDKARPVPSIYQKKLFIRGYFADKANFDSIRPILLSEFTPKQAPLIQNTELYKAIAKTNSVCISVRRGDYLSKENKSNFFVCDEAYFQKAISIICEKVESPTLIFFSDDIQWVSEHIYYDDYPCFYETGTDPIWEKLRLMYSCHHFIISNSTFSWWAQYLGQREGKIVISPSRWFANRQWHSNLIDDDFIQID